jgi:hypothetical protein
MPFMMVQPLSSLGSIYVEMSLRFIDQVSEFHRHALRLLETPAGVSGGGTAWADLGWCALTLGDSQLAEESFQKGLNTPTMFMLLERPRLLAGAALLASKRGRHEEARHRIEEAREYAAERTMRHIFPLISLTSAWIWAAQHAHDQALSEAKRAQAEADKLRMRPILWQAQLAESRALEALGRPGEAQQKRHSAQAIIEEIAALFEDEGLRHGFLSNALARLEEPVYWPFS